MEFSAQNLKFMAAEVVTDYVAHRVPLSSAVATKAKASKLNTEQIKRLIEISNQVAYLKLLEKASDRTFEFPLAVYEDVMAILATPDESMKKEASQKLSPIEIASGKMEENLEKVAHTQEDDELGFLKRASKNERIAMLNKQLYRTKGELEKVACDEQVMAVELVARAADLREDDQFLSKVAMILDGDENTLTKISRLVYGEKVDYCNDELFYEADIEDAREYVDMFKQAEELVDTRQGLESQVSRAEDVLEKEAFAPAFTAIGNLATRAGQVAKPIVEGAQKIGGKVVEKGMGAAEKTFFVADNMASGKRRGIHKSLRRR